jgi:hypothetical protein
MFDLLECWLASELALQAPDGPLEARELQVRWEGEGAVVGAFFLRFQVSLQDWARIDEAELFELHKARRGEHFAGGFLDSAPIEIEVRLRDGLLSKVTHEAEDIFDAAANVLATPELQRESAWVGQLAVQERLPGLKTGFTMTP